MARKRPINKKTAAYDILCRHKTPVPAVEAVRAVVAERKVRIRWNCHGFVGRRQKLHVATAPVRVAGIPVLPGCDSLKHVVIRGFAINEKIGFSNPQRVARESR